MKKIKILAMAVTVAFTTTSCVKNWTCVCTDGTTTNNYVYKESKLLTAADKCNDREANIRLLVPATNCSIK